MSLSRIRLEYTVAVRLRVPQNVCAGLVCLKKRRRFCSSGVAFLSQCARFYTYSSVAIWAWSRRGTKHIIHLKRNILRVTERELQNTFRTENRHRNCGRVPLFKFRCARYVCLHSKNLLCGYSLLV